MIKKDTAQEAMQRFSTDRQAEEALAALKKYWEDLLSIYSVESKDEKLDRMVNIWNQYQ